MNEDNIIKLWRQGYSVEQITDMSVMVQKTKGDDDTRNFVKNRVESVILKYQT